MNRVALDLGFVQIYWYSIMLYIAMFVGISVILKEVKRLGKSEDFFVNLIFNSLIVGIIGARLYFVLFHLDYYSDHLLEIFEIWNGGLAIHGGLLFGGLYAIYFCYKCKENLYGTLDVCISGLLIGQSIGRWGNYFNQEAYGKIVSESYLRAQHLPEFIIEGMKINGAYRQPTFLYESIWNFIGFIIVLVLRRVKYLKTGYLLAFYMVWYSLGRFVIEGMRSDSLMFGPLKIAQVVSVALIILGIVLFLYRKKGSKLDSLYDPSKAKIKIEKKEAQEEFKKEEEKNVQKRAAQEDTKTEINGSSLASQLNNLRIKNKNDVNSNMASSEVIPVVNSGLNNGINPQGVNNNLSQTSGGKRPITKEGQNLDRTINK